MKETEKSAARKQFCEPRIFPQCGHLQRQVFILNYDRIKDEKQNSPFLRLILNVLSTNHCKRIYFFETLRAQYFRLVASPPRICRSARFFWSTCRTSPQRRRSISFRRSVTSLCTVDLLMLKCFAQSRTVAPVFKMYSAHWRARRSIYSHTLLYPRFLLSQWYILCRFLTVYDAFIRNTVKSQTCTECSSECEIRFPSQFSPVLIGKTSRGCTLRLHIARYRKW